MVKNPTKTKKAKRITRLGFYVPKAWTIEKVMENVRKAKEERDMLLENVRNLHVSLQNGNNKTGMMSKTVSLYPVLDCNCDGCPCAEICYDMRHDIINKDCRKYRLINSAIHKADPERYWWEIEKKVKEEFCIFLRGNVGGDLTNDDYLFLFDMCKRNERCTCQYFSKNYNGGNNAIKANRGELPDNLKLMYSRLPNLECENPYEIPESHINFGVGCPFTGPEYGAYFCNGNCTECFYDMKGCIGAKRRDNIVLNYH